MQESCVARREARTETSQAPVRERRRHELARLLNEIRATTPSAEDVVAVVRDVAGGELSPRRLDQIAREIRHLYGGA